MTPSSEGGFFLIDLVPPLAAWRLGVSICWHPRAPEVLDRRVLKRQDAMTPSSEGGFFLIDLLPPLAAWRLGVSICWHPRAHDESLSVLPVSARNAVSKLASRDSIRAIVDPDDSIAAISGARGPFGTTLSDR